MILPLYILFIEGIIPVIIKLYLSLIPYTLLLLISHFIGLIFICFYLYFFKFDEIIEGYINLNYKILFIIILISFFGTFIARIIYLKIINDNQNINIFIILMSLYPIITIIASYFLLQEELSNRQLIGYLFIIIGIYFLLYKTS
jgi:drug/metabolite transporter (DMT)-like permease